MYDGRRPISHRVIHRVAQSRSAVLSDVKGLPCPLPAAAPRRLQGTDCVPGMPIMHSAFWAFSPLCSIHRWEGRRKGGKLLGRWEGAKLKRDSTTAKALRLRFLYSFVFYSLVLPVAHFGLLTVERSTLGATPSVSLPFVLEVFRGRNQAIGNKNRSPVKKIPPASFFLCGRIIVLSSELCQPTYTD